jgi:hypothetical protein
MVPSSRHRRVQQLANMLHDKSMSLKLENIIVFTMKKIFINMVFLGPACDGQHGYQVPSVNSSLLIFYFVSKR